MMLTPSQRFYRGHTHKSRKILTGLDRGLHGCVGSWKRRAAIFHRLEREADQVIKLFTDSIANLSEAEFLDRLTDVRREFLRGKGNAFRIEGIACVMRAARDQLGMTPYRVQVIGALAIDRALFAEMATGEGKTLTIGLAGVLAGWRNKPCHIITSNDYLAERDTESLLEFYEFCGLDVGFIIGKHNADDRVEQYRKSVVYTTSQQLLADHLKDRIALGDQQAPGNRLVRHLSRTEGRQSLITRGIHTVIIDEADNILIDEAVTPLIISQEMKGDSFEQCCRAARQLIYSLKAGKHYKIDYKYQEVALLNEGRNQLKRYSHRLPPIWRSLSRSEELVRQALVAENFFELDRNYVVSEAGKVEIVDESTGRIMEGRTWKQGLHQAIEAKEKLPISDPTETLASMSFQRFFRSFNKLSGVSGTAWESRGELWKVYELAVVQIPTHRPILRKMETDRMFAKSADRDLAVVAEIVKINKEGRPILVGTRSVEASERLSKLLQEEGLFHSVLNAVKHEEESEIIAKAGQGACITIATNMAGRGTDIKIDEAGLSKGGLHVIVAECNLSPRIDRQLIGRSSRQGEPGSARLYVCLEDELFKRFLKRKTSSGLSPKQLRMRAQRLAERMGAKQRAAMLRMDSWMEKNLSFTRVESR